MAILSLLSNNKTQTSDFNNYKPKSTNQPKLSATIKAIFLEKMALLNTTLESTKEINRTSPLLLMGETHLKKGLLYHSIDSLSEAYSEYLHAFYLLSNPSIKSHENCITLQKEVMKNMKWCLDEMPSNSSFEIYDSLENEALKRSNSPIPTRTTPPPSPDNILADEIESSPIFSDFRSLNEQYLKLTQTEELPTKSIKKPKLDHQSAKAARTFPPKNSVYLQLLFRKLNNCITTREYTKVIEGLTIAQNLLKENKGIECLKLKKKISCNINYYSKFMNLYDTHLVNISEEINKYSLFYNKHLFPIELSNLFYQKGCYLHLMFNYPGAVYYYSTALKTLNKSSKKHTHIELILNDLEAAITNKSSLNIEKMFTKLCEFTENFIEKEEYQTKITFIDDFIISSSEPKLTQTKSPSKT